MSEEEIIKYLKTIKPKNFNNYKDETPCSLITKKQIKAIQGLLNLYKKEKEKNKEYEKLHLTEYKIAPDGNLLSKTIKLDDYVHKDRIRELMERIDKGCFDEGWWYLDRLQELLEERN